MTQPYLLFGTKQRATNPLSVNYLKRQCVFPVSTISTPDGRIAIAGAAGTITPYTVGYVCLALNSKSELTISRQVLDVMAQSGVIQLAILTNFGAGYTVGDNVTLQGGNTNGVIHIDSVDGLGHILTWTLSNPGTGYLDADEHLAVTGGTGTGAEWSVYSDVMQHKEGWWYDHYNPYVNAVGATFQRIPLLPNGLSGDLRVDSDAAMLLWAMSDWDARQSPPSTRYLQPVRRALQWLYTLQQAHLAANGTNLIANLEYQGVADTNALLADCGEVLLSMIQAMDAYGDTLTTSGGTSVKTIANDLYQSMTDTWPTGGWGGTSNPIYRTGLPGQNAPPFTFSFYDPISYTQGICARANKAMVDSGYLTGASRSDQAEKALDHVYPRTKGQWGGQFYTYFDSTDSNTTRIEFLAYTALMCLGMQAVNPTRYAHQISGMIDAIRRRARANGVAWSEARETGALVRATLSAPNRVPEIEGYGFTVIDIAEALLTGA